MNDHIVVSVSPHITTPQNTASIMRDVCIGLMPALLVSVYVFGIRSLLITVVSVVTCVASEYVFSKLVRKPHHCNDLSAVVTGILFAFCLPPGIPVWTAVIGAILSIVVGKEIFGGVGHNPFNPALVGRAFLLASWPVPMTVWQNPVRSITRGVDALSSATPLVQMKTDTLAVTNLDLFLGQVSGCIGETSAAAILIGALYLFGRGIIRWHIPVSYVGTVALLAGILGQDMVFHVFAGGLMLGAFFMATDYVTSPINPKGKIIFGIGCGVLTVLIRLYGGFPEGVCYAILLMNALVPLIDRYTQPVQYGVS
ncbi:MAG: RnfABCDGE type electron transport complex subunit D [Elusimicrobia bacterium]|nr:RnfABCDGE type electron transport complex subunit D [Elusimicrobiota bacterium]MBD3412453.1 RnfABCDGE type electron transport complex subunit D [Elusimicrobiota bacterium]